MNIADKLINKIIYLRHNKKYNKNKPNLIKNQPNLIQIVSCDYYSKDLQVRALPKNMTYDDCFMIMSYYTDLIVRLYKIKRPTKELAKKLDYIMTDLNIKPYHKDTFGLTCFRAYFLNCVALISDYYPWYKVGVTEKDVDKIYAKLKRTKPNVLIGRYNELEKIK